MMSANAENQSTSSNPPLVEIHTGPSGFRTEIAIRGHRFTADEPVEVGGTDAGPTPYEHLLSAIGGCTAMTLRMYADRKRWPLEQIIVRLWHGRDYADDCDHCETQQVGVHRVERHIQLIGPLDEEQRMRLLSIAERCPVKQTLANCIRIDSVSSAPENGTLVPSPPPVT